MSVDAGGGKLKWPKATKKVNKQAHQKNFLKIQEMQGWLTGEKSMGTRVGMEHVHERPYVQLSTGHHTHINIPTCGVLR